MSTKETGGPAFPVWCDYAGTAPDCGMTLRDYFAATALTGAFNSSGFQDEFTFAEKARWVYDMADAMLEARKS